MKIKVTTRTIELPTNTPRNPSVIQADAIMAAITSSLNDGTRYGAVKLSGYWVIGKFTPSWSRISPEPLGRSFAKALANAFGRDVVTPQS